MRKSITTKLYIVIVLVFAILNIFGLVFNNIYLEKFYISNNGKQLKEALAAAVKASEKADNIRNFDREQIESDRGVKVSIIAKDEIEKILLEYKEQMKLMKQPPGYYNARKGNDYPPPQKPMFADKVPRFLGDVDQMITDVFSGKEVYKEVKIPDDKARLLIMTKKDNKGNIIIVSKSIFAVKEAVKIANEFYYIASFMSLVIGIICIFILSRKITKPIIELNRAAHDLSKLDFSRKVKLRTSDELEELGNSINHMSVELESKINALNETNAKLVKEVEKERKIEKMRREFISNVSHELKTPLAIIGGYAAGLMELVNIDKEKRDYYSNVILDETKKMSVMVTELLELSRLESDTKPLKKEVFELRGIIEELIRKYKYIVKEKNATIIFFYPDSAVNIEGDSFMISQAVNNIVTNALKYVSENGEITIRVIGSENMASVEVENTGENIPEEHLKDIWLPFYKIDEARSREKGGTGLGLAIVKGIVEKHEGICDVMNTETGVRFMLGFKRKP